MADSGHILFQQSCVIAVSAGAVAAVENLGFHTVGLEDLTGIQYNGVGNCQSRDGGNRPRLGAIGADGDSGIPQGYMVVNADVAEIRQMLSILLPGRLRSGFLPYIL